MDDINPCKALQTHLNDEDEDRSKYSSQLLFLSITEPYVYPFIYRCNPTLFNKIR